MKKLFFFLALTMGLTYGMQAQVEKVYNEEIDAMEQIQQAIEEARETIVPGGRQLVPLVSALCRVCCQ